MIKHGIQMPDCQLPSSETSIRKLLDLFLQPQAQLIETKIRILHAHHPITHAVQHADTDRHKMSPILKRQKGIRRVIRFKPRLHPLRQILPVKVLIRIGQQTVHILCKVGPHLGKHMGRKQAVTVSQNADIRLRHCNLPKPPHRNRGR